jgi:hypothetical protein
MAIAHYSRAVSGDVCDVINTALGTAATISFYTDPRVADTTVGITTQDLLGTCTCANPAGVESGGTLTFSAIANDASADDTGICTWVRIRDASSTTIMDLDVTATGGGGYVQMASTSITAGGPIAFNSFTITLP